MFRDEDTGERICEVCKKPFKKKHTRWDTKTCSPKCRQQAYRNRIFAAQQARYEEARAKREKKSQANAKAYAKRKQRRKAQKRTPSRQT